VHSLLGVLYYVVVVVVPLVLGVLTAIAPAVVRWFTTSHSELSIRARDRKFLSVGMVRIFYLTRLFSIELITL